MDKLVFFKDSFGLLLMILGGNFLQIQGIGFILSLFFWGTGCFVVLGLTRERVFSLNKKKNEKFAEFWNKVLQSGD